MFVQVAIIYAVVKMHSVTIHEAINRLISVLYRLGFWHYEGSNTVIEFGMKSFYSVYYSLFTITLALGAVQSENLSEAIFAAQISIAVGVLAVKLWILMWKQRRILELLSRVCVFSIRYEEDFTFFNKKLEKFMSFVTTFLSASVTAVVIELGVFPFISGSERNLIFNIEFMLFDWRKNEITYWIAYTFLCTELWFTLIAIVFSVFVWYSMLLCSLRYEVLGREIRKMGSKIGNGKEDIIMRMENGNLFLTDLRKSILDHLHLRRLIYELESLISKLFLIQFGASSFSICGSLYCLAFDTTNDLAKTMIYVYSTFYHISELFMITYLGNEILLSSYNINYNFFQSDWIEQPQSTKTSMIVFAEYLQKPHKLVIGKMYPLTLETFTKILKSAYSLFNILKTTKK